MEHIFITYNQINFSLPVYSCLVWEEKKQWKFPLQVIVTHVPPERNLQIYSCNIFVFRRQTGYLKHNRHRHEQTLEIFPTSTIFYTRQDKKRSSNWSKQFLKALGVIKT